MSETNLMTQNDMCIYKENGKVKALGYSINSKFLKNDIPISSHYQSGGSADSAGKELAIPAGLFFLKKTVDANTKLSSTKDLFEKSNSLLNSDTDKIIEGGKKIKNKDVIGKSLYEKLLLLSNRKEINNTKNNTKHKTRKKRRRNILNNKTRKKNKYR